MSPYLGYGIAIGILAVIVFFSGRVVIRNIRSQLKERALVPDAEVDARVTDAIQLRKSQRK